MYSTRYSCHIESNLIFLDRFFKNVLMSNFVNICLVGTEWMHRIERRTDKKRDMMMIVVFRNYANAPKIQQQI